MESWGKATTKDHQRLESLRLQMAGQHFFFGFRLGGKGREYIFGFRDHGKQFGHRRMGESTVHGAPD